MTIPPCQKNSRDAVGTMHAPTWKYIGTQENEVSWGSVGHGPTGADEACLPVSASVTRGPADSCAISMTIVVAAAKKMIITRQSTRALTVSSGMSRGMSGGSWSCQCTPMETPMIGNRAAGYENETRPTLLEVCSKTSSATSTSC